MNNFCRASITVLPMLLAAAANAPQANAQSQLMCYNPAYNAWQPCTSANPLAVTPSGSGSVIVSGVVSTQAAQTTPAPPDISTVTTSGVAVNAFSAGHCARGCYIFNPVTASVRLCGNGVTTASGTDTNAATICVVPGQSLVFPPRSGAISVVSSDSAHTFGGEGYQ